VAAVRLPGAESALTPIVSAVSLANAVLFAIVFAVLVPLCLFRGPLNVSDPTSTRTVWASQYAGVRPERAMVSTLPYTWIVGAAGIVLTAVLYLD
jgi:hypothetical protein